jgi:subtilase family serine protease
VGGANLRFGSAINASPSGSYQGEMVWNDPYGAGGGGFSILFGRPNFQEGTLPRSIGEMLGNSRGVPDVAYNAGVVGGVIAAWAGIFTVFGGTSAGSPQWAAITSEINQGLGGPIGFINNQLYRLGHTGALSSLLHDITQGNNGFDDVTGFSASPGYDLASGWGTPNFGKLGFLLADPDEDSHCDDTP